MPRLLVVMLSLARSRHTLLAQNLFTALNAAGVLLGVYYNANTPDLYPGDAHRKLGWLVTVLMGGHLLVGVVARAAGGLKREKRGLLAGSSPEERRGFMRVPVSAEAMAEHESRFPAGPYSRFSNDSGQGTEPRTESLRSHSLSSGVPSSPIREAHKEYRHSGDDGDDDEDLEGHLPVFRTPAKPHAVILKVAKKISGRLYTALVFWYNFVDRTVLILGFIALCTGIISFARFFVSRWRLVGLELTTLTNDRRAAASSADWPIGSRAASSFGWVFSPSAAGRAALAILDG